MTRFDVSGSATDEESAAIAAVVAEVLSRELEVLSAPPTRPQQSDWVRAWRPAVPHLTIQPQRRFLATSDEDEER